MKEIGGYFELEIDYKDKLFHSTAIALNTARNCLEYILKAHSYNKIYIPYYTCDVLLEPILKLDLSYEFYHIDSDLNPVFEKELLEDEVFLYTNYYGVKTKTVRSLVDRFGTQLIIDNSQSFFSELIDGIDTFYSARKFFGLPDGAYLYSRNKLSEKLEKDTSMNRMEHLLTRIEFGASSGFSKYKENDNSLENNEIKEMSALTSSLIKGIDSAKVRKIRLENFRYLHSRLAAINTFVFDDLECIEPMVYPFVSMNDGLRKHLIDNKVYVATYWPNVLDWVDEQSIEQYLVNHLLPLPIDQRYTQEDMDRIINLIV